LILITIVINTITTIVRLITATTIIFLSLPLTFCGRFHDGLNESSMNRTNIFFILYLYSIGSSVARWSSLDVGGIVAAHIRR
jgi:hypothetical protein